MYVKFQLYSSNSFPHMRGSQIYTRGAAPLRPPPPCEKKFHTHIECYPIYLCVKFQLSVSNSSRDMKGIQNFTMGRQISTQTSPSFWGQSSRAFLVSRRVSHSVWTAAIVDVKFRCKVVRRLMSNSSLRNARGFGWFLWGRDLLTFEGALLNYTQTGYCVKVWAESVQ